MTIEHKRLGIIALSVLVIFSMLFAAFAGMAPRIAGTSATSGTALVTSGVRDLSGLTSACAMAPVPLGSASTYAALSGTGVTNTGPSSLTGDLGVSPGSAVTGFPPGTYTGTKNVANPPAAWAEANLTTAYNDAAGRTLCPVSVAGNLGGQTLTPGLYKSTSTMAISSGDLTLSGGGDPNGVFIFQVASALTTTSGRAVILTNGAQAGNVFWQVGSSASLGTTSVMKGTIMAYASVTMATGSHLEGRALARTGDVTLANSTIVVPTTSTSVPTYAVTFTESGLPSTGTSWSVTLNGVLISSTTPTIGFNMANGTYAYTVGTVVGFTPSPSSGSLPVTGAAVSRTIVFTANAAETFSVSFAESGLTSGTSWSVTFNGVLKSSVTATIVFTATNGAYTYTVGTVSGYSSSPSAGSVPVSGAAASQAIVFTALPPGTFSVTFTESGLASGTSWSVTFDGVLKSSTTETVVFNEANGSYAYTIGAVTGYTSSPSSGSPTVNGLAMNKAIVFTSIGGGGPGGGGGGGSGGGGGTTASTGIRWDWILLGIVAVGLVAILGAAAIVQRRHMRAP